MSEHNKTVFSANLVFFMKLNDVSRYDLSEALNVPYPTVCDWISAKKYPRIGSIEKIAQFFHIKKAALIEEHENSATVIGSVRVLSIYDDMNENGRKALIDYAEFLYSKPENKKSYIPTNIVE
jgi:transcriptional regulator with XRE-family HTH domain